MYAQEINNISPSNGFDYCHDYYVVQGCKAKIRHRNHDV